MLLSTLWLLASAAAANSAKIPDIPLIKPGDLVAKEVTQGGFIVQLKNDASLTKRSGGRTTHERFHKRASIGLDYKVRTEFTNDKLFYGLSIQLSKNKTTSEVQSILSDIPEVQDVWPIRLVHKPSPVQAGGNLSAVAGKSSHSVSSKWAPVDDSPVLPLIKGANVLSTHKMADVDKLHAKGIKGKGIKIALVDTGK